ncbi:MAG: helix-turn-helix domain-containing protein [Ruminococcaceae bacterium]|nr:helix-turn-helix domain-containing protein [Oscillospiraceae bacterium]
MNLETAKRLLKYRKLHNLSQEKLAEQIGVSRQAVSKWERGEASPDTDNLIALSKLYNISLDKLVLGESEPSVATEKASETFSKKSEETITEEINKTNSAPETNYEDEESTNEDENELYSEDKEDEEKRKSIQKALYRFPYPVVATILFFIYGFTGIGGGWVYGWLVFLTIPLYYTFIPAFFKRKPVIFCYPVFVTWIYLFLGFKYTLWHPMWILFLTIPLYYSVCSNLSRK